MNISKKHYSALDEIPLHNWEKCLEGNFQYMCKKSIKNWGATQVKAFEVIYDKYIKKYGLGKLYDEYLELKKTIALLELSYVETGDKFILNQIQIEQVNLKALEPTSEGGMSIGQIVVHLSKWMGDWINKKKITVEEYKSLLQEYEHSQKK